jgi:membrane protease YdiL (CAAX protease family)
MHDPAAALDIPTPILLDEAPRPRGHPVIAWLAIVLLVGIAVVLTDARPASKDPQGKNHVALLLMQMQGRYIVGAASLLGHSDPSFYRQVQALNVGPVPERLRFVVLAGELAGPKEALRHLDELRQLLARKGTKPTATDAAIIDSLATLYSAYEAKEFDTPNVSREQRELLQHELGWFGELALAPAGGPDPAARKAVLAVARRTALGLFLAFGVAGILGVLGFVGLIVLLACLATGLVRSGLVWPSGHGAIYAETFALYLALFFLFSFQAALLPLEGSRLLLSGAAALASLLALAWPVLRGVPWQQVRQEIGLTAGRSPALEPFLGVASYAMALPLLAVGALMTLCLLAIQKALQGANPADSLAPAVPLSHPVVQYLAGPGWWGRLQVVLLASVVAPLVEETMFRGVLYRHLRDGSSRFGFWGSVLFSGTLTSFVFAVIHPQGWVAVPALMALAYAFTLAREWRGTLVPAMVAHGINNAVVTTLGIFALSG